MEIAHDTGVVVRVIPAIVSTVVTGTHDFVNAPQSDDTTVVGRGVTQSTIPPPPPHPTVRGPGSPAARFMSSSTEVKMMELEAVPSAKILPPCEITRPEACYRRLRRP